MKRYKKLFFSSSYSIRKIMKILKFNLISLTKTKQNLTKHTEECFYFSTEPDERQDIFTSRNY